jgi:hypothetical protein
MFNDILVNCPNNPNKYLDRAFKNWENEVSIFKPHKDFINIKEEQGFKIIKIILYLNINFSLQKMLIIRILLIN